MKLIVEKQVTRILEGTSMVISRGSSISADSVEITVLDGDKKVFHKKYSYGYDASYKKDFATKDKPFIEDIIKELKAQYNVTNVKEVKGSNAFLKESTELRVGQEVCWFDAGCSDEMGIVKAKNPDGSYKVRWEDGKVSNCPREHLMTPAEADSYDEDF